MSAGDEHVLGRDGGGDGSVPRDRNGGGDEGRGGEHLDWRISALLDGELSVTEEIVAREHLSGCELCQQEFAEVTAARSLVRGLGEVEPPRGTLDRVVRRIVRRRQITGIGIVGLVTLAVAWVLLLFLVVRVALPAVTPPLDEFVGTHADLVAAPASSPDGYERLTGEEIAALDAPYVAPAQLGPELQREAVFRRDDIVLVQYRAPDGTAVSVFEQIGVLEDAGLPGQGARVAVEGHPGWLAAVRVGDNRATVVVLPRRPIVFTVVTSEGSQAFESAAALPDSREFSIGDRVRRNLRDALGIFGSADEHS